MNSNGTLPDTWHLAKIGEITLPIEKVDPKQFPNQRFQYLDISGIDNQRNVVVEHKVYLGKDAPSRARQVVQADDILFSTVRTYLKNIAKVPKNFDGEVASTGFSILRAANGISSDYLFYFSLTSQFLNPLADLQRGTSYPAVRDNDVRDQTIPIPPQDEQKRIVAKIEALFAELDAGVASLELAQAQLQTYRQALLKHAFEGKLTAQWRTANADKLEDAATLLQRIKAERQAHHQAELATWKEAVKTWEANGKPGKKPSKPSPPKDLPPLTPAELANLPQLPAGWAWTKVESIADKVTDGEHITPNRTSSGFYLLSARNIQNGFLDLSNVDYVPLDEYERIRKRCDPEEGDILISCSGSVGRVCRVPKNIEFVMVRSVALVKMQAYRKTSKFYEYLFQSPLLQKQIEKGKKATAQANLFLGPINNLKIIICSENERIAIIEEVEARLSVIDQLEQTISTALQQAEAMRQSILKKAFAGQLVPQDPTDEPASALLARIRTAKS